MTVVTLKGLPAGNATLHYAAKVEGNRNGLLPLPAALQTTAVSGSGQVSFDLTEGIEYVVFASDGQGRHVMSASTPITT